MPSGPGKTSRQHGLGPKNLYSYDLSNEVKIHLKFDPPPLSPTIFMYVENPKGINIKLVSNEFIFISSSFEKFIAIEADYFYQFDHLYQYYFIKGMGSELPIYSEIVAKWTIIPVQTNFVDITDIEIKLPQLSINGKIEDIPNVRFDKKEGTVFITNR